MVPNMQKRRGICYLSLGAVAPEGRNFVKFPVKFPDNREFGFGDRFVSDCTHHQAFQETGDLTNGKTSRGLRSGLEFCSRFEFQRRRFIPAHAGNSLPAHLGMVVVASVSYTHLRAHET